MIAPPATSATAPRPVVSVVIPAFNAGAHLGACLDSVQAQAGDFELEVIVVDDDSTDDTAALAAARPNVTLLCQGVNAGPSRARNAGIAVARGEFVAFLDADDLWSEGSLAARIGVLQRRTDAALVFGDCRQFDEHGPRECTLFQSFDLGSAGWGPDETVQDSFLRLLADNFITTGSVVARRAVLSTAGGFAEDLRLVEDLDLWLRLARQHVIAWCPQVCLLRRRHAANLSREPVAMSLAYLEVLRRQHPDAEVAPPELARRLRTLTAREQLHLAALERDLGHAGDALRWALRSLRTQPGARALWRLGLSAMQMVTHRAGANFGPKTPP